MIRFGLIVALLGSPLVSAQIRGTPVWDAESLPITIEVLRDVPVKTSARRTDGSYGHERGSLYSGTAFRISKGQRFQRVEMSGEGGCRIEFQGSQYALSSCPWVPGFTDNQGDIFSIVAFPKP